MERKRKKARARAREQGGEQRRWGNRKRERGRGRKWLETRVGMEKGRRRSEKEDGGGLGIVSGVG